MNGCNPRVPEKIPDVERKYMRDLVDAHSGCEPRIVNLHARYRMRHEHIPPLLMYGLTVFKKCELIFDKSRAEVLRKAKGHTRSARLGVYRYSRTQPNSGRCNKDRRQPSRAVG
jgi:hypothetical protein